MNIQEQFLSDCKVEVRRQGDDLAMLHASREWINRANNHKYSYHFEWQGRPIIQYPQDMMAMQELIWQIKPDLIIETGIAHGGSQHFSDSMFAPLKCCDAVEQSMALG